MKYFTPELFIDYNSPDDEVADRADTEWAAAEVRYKERLAEIRQRMPEHVRELSRLCLHDAEVLSRHTVHQPNAIDAPCNLSLPFWSALEVITLRRGDEVICLFYTLAEGVRTNPPPDEWTFSKGGPMLWLYDEVDVLAERRPTVYCHSVLFSTGLALEIPFVTVLIHRVSLAVPAMAEA